MFGFIIGNQRSLSVRSNSYNLFTLADTGSRTETTPAVLLGSKDRFIGQGYLAAKQPDRAITHLVRAEEENREFGALHLRTRFDLARALLCQPDSRADAEAELKALRCDARTQGMPKLAEQAQDSIA